MATKVVRSHIKQGKPPLQFETPPNQCDSISSGEDGVRDSQRVRSKAEKKRAKAEKKRQTKMDADTRLDVLLEKHRMDTLPEVPHSPTLLATSQEQDLPYPSEQPQVRGPQSAATVPPAAAICDDRVTASQLTDMHRSILDAIAASVTPLSTQLAMLHSRVSELEHRYQNSAASAPVPPPPEREQQWPLPATASRNSDTTRTADAGRRTSSVPPPPRAPSGTPHRPRSASPPRASTAENFKVVLQPFAK
eukprot:6456256-Amphidinium_carterae.1